MEIDLSVLNKQEVESTNPSERKMRLSANAESVIFQMFTNNIYSNPIGTIVREITSNCFDSHIEAKVNEPVLIKKSLDSKTDTTYISFIDYGVGMSPDRVENIYGVYFESTKRNNNDEIGGFGIGGKTPLAYKRQTGLGEGEYDNSFFVITNYNGTKYYYCIYEGAKSPIINEIHREETDERNGTEIRIPVLSQDIDKFEQELHNQLFYFENVIFDGFSNDERLNGYQIFKGKTFLYRKNAPYNRIHVCLGKVAYPIDYNAINLNGYDYEYPIAVNINIGDIEVTPSRESLKYSESTIKLLKNKIEQVKSEIVEMVTKQYQNVVTLEDYFRFKENFGNLYFDDENSINVKGLVQLKDLEIDSFKYSFLSNRMFSSSSDLFNTLFKVKLFGAKESTYSWRNDGDTFKGSYKGITNAINAYFVKKEFKRVVLKQSYLKDRHPKRWYLITPKNLNDINVVDQIAERFNIDAHALHNVHLDAVKDVQKEFLGIMEQHIEDYDKIEVPEDFKLQRKGKLLTEDILKTTIPVSFSSYGKERIEIKKLVNFKGKIFYGFTDDKYLIDQTRDVHEILFGDNHVVKSMSYYSKKLKGIMFIRIAKNNEKYMKYCSNAFHYSMYKTKMLYRKENIILNYRQKFENYNLFDEIDGTYKSEVFFQTLGQTELVKIVEEIKAYLLHNQDGRATFSRMDNHKNLINKFYPQDQIPVTSEDLKIKRKIQKLNKLQEVNQPYMKHIQMPYRMSYLADEKELIELLNKVMVF
jgi:virulence-associated protein VapD